MPDTDLEPLEYIRKHSYMVHNLTGGHKQNLINAINDKLYGMLESTVH